MPKKQKLVLEYLEFLKAVGVVLHGFRGDCRQFHLLLLQLGPELR